MKPGTSRILPARLAQSFACGAMACGLLALSGCATEERLVRYKPFLAGIEGARFGTDPVTDSPKVRPPDPTAVADAKIVIENADRSITLVSRSPRHVMQHVERCLDNDQDDLLFEQIIANSTKDNFKSKGQDPRSYLKWLHENRRDIAKLFSRLPQGESTPTAFLHQFADRVWRIDVVGGYAKDLRFTRLWVQLEKGQWKLMWID